MSHAKSQFIAELFEQQAIPLVRYLTARFNNADEAREVAQDAWLRLYSLEHPEKLENARAFLFQTAANLNIDRIRKANLERKHAEHSEPISRDLDEVIDAQQRLHTIEAAIFELPPKVRQAFVMHRKGNLSYPAIAEQLGVSTSMVEKYIIQALKHFRNKLAQ